MAQRLRAEMKKIGVIKDLTQLVPPPVPPEHDYTSTYLKAFSLLSTKQGLLESNPPTAMRMVARGKALVGFKQPQLVLNENTNSWDEARGAVLENKDLLALVQEMPENSGADFHILYERGFCEPESINNLHLAQFKKTALILGASALCDLQSGNTDGAVTKVRRMLILANTVRTQRLLISELVGMSIINIAQALTWEILQSDHVHDPALMALQSEWQRVNVMENYQRSIALERACSYALCDSWRDSQAELEKYINLQKKARATLGFEDEQESFLRKVTDYVQVWQWRYWGSYVDETRSLKGELVLCKTLENIATNSAFVPALINQEAGLKACGIVEIPDTVENLFNWGTDLTRMVSSDLLIQKRATKKVIQTETMRRMSLRQLRSNVFIYGTDIILSN